MSDTPGNGADHTPSSAGAPQGTQQAALAIHGQYVKDLSFESPNAPGILADLQNQQPDINVNVDVQAAKLEGPQAANYYEVILDMRAELKLGEKVGFIVELKYAGVFAINVPEEHLGGMLLVECPRILFPFARNILADATRDGGFVPLMLQPIDFAAMYQANMAQQVKNLDQDVAAMVDAENNKKA
ncbi:protein-export chaperone SecB [Magnetovibrio blakemorei]|uniref:Protein-export protein SecB n=1 Tax=Magnetovibrio blakemorei TaxID=28181 RepID=A0A1E5Q4A7_9PROT|nr:protein-export chaperone SecB [Magnetovibrio blakemorei]OEJ64417.1 protein-export chaperone SecB [Magnetovibrio blakemorei]